MKRIHHTVFTAWTTALIISMQLITAPQSAAFTIGEEKDIGEKLFYKIRSEFTLLDDPDISQYINELGDEVLAQAGPRFFDYHFFIIDSPQFNAFAAPSGLIFFFSGLIETMDDEDELLSVMAHEIGHVVSRHIASRSSKAGKVGAISMALSIASLALGDPSLATGLFTGFQAAGQAAALHFSRQDEEEADRLSYEWLHAMRRDPKSMEDMLRTMRRIARYRSEKIPPYLLTHPNPEARLDYVQSMLDYQRRQVKEGYYRESDDFAFLRMKYRVIVKVADPQKARAFFTTAITNAGTPDESIMATYGLALLQASELDFEHALENLAKVRQHYPGRSILDVDAGIMHLDSGNTSRAVELLSEASRQEPGDMYAAFHLARAYEKTGRLDSAEKLYSRVMKAMPEYSRVYFEMGRIKSLQGEKSASNFYLAKHYLYEGKVDMAREHLARASSDNGLDQSLRDEAAELLARLDELDKL